MSRLLSAAVSLLVLPVVVLAVPGAALAATPSPSPSPCTRPNGFTFTASSTRVDSGQPVTLTVTFYQCGTSQEHQFTVSAHPLGQSSPLTTVGHLTTPAQQQGSASLTVRPEQDTTYIATEDGQTYSQPPSVDVTVNRVSGSCAGVVRLAAPATPLVGSLVPVTGSTSDTGTVTISFRKRGQSAFQVRRTLTPRADGTFNTSFLADDDYRLFASTSRCDSQPLLVQAQPVITGPATAPRGSTVTLTLRVAPRVQVRVYLHRSGTTGYALRRTVTSTASGTYTTTYTADADYRYYAITGPDGRHSNTGLTQVR